MSIKNSIGCIDMNQLIESVRIHLVCPVCSTNKIIDIPKSVVRKAKNLSTVSIPEKIVCSHHFQVFIDQNFKVRGYQKVDYTLKNEQKKRDLLQKNKNIVDNLLFKGNFVEYSGIPTHDHTYSENKNNNYTGRASDKIDIKNDNKSKILLREQSKRRSIIGEKSMKEIYEDFWEYIDDDNEIFMDFIKNDERKLKY
ncbi:MAG: hypothetical protein P8Y70_06235 [Candidatus Lokiarchaeota archaeon]